MTSTQVVFILFSSFNFVLFAQIALSSFQSSRLFFKLLFICLVGFRDHPTSASKDKYWQTCPTVKKSCLLYE